VYTINSHSDTSTKETGHCDRRPSRVNLDGNESKNFVPVEWVSAVMSHIISNPQHHGETYHLTPRNPVQTRTVHAALQASAKFFGSELCGKDTVVENPVDVEKFFYQHIQIYNSYWRNDPTFDSTNTRNAAPHLPCPYIDYQKLLFLARQAIDMNFTWRDKPVKREEKTLIAG